jgi:hypothetical protein
VLEYAAERLVLEAEQLRSRLGMLIGVVDKVGIIPMTVGTVISSYKFVAEANVRPSYIAKSGIRTDRVRVHADHGDKSIQGTPVSR